MTEKVLKKGKIPSMAELKAAYNCILQVNHVASPPFSRKKLKQLISTEITNVEFHKPKRLSYFLSTDIPYWKNVIYESFPNERFHVSSAKDICFYFCNEDVDKLNPPTF